MRIIKKGVLFFCRVFIIINSKNYVFSPFFITFQFDAYEALFDMLLQPRKPDTAGFSNYYIYLAESIYADCVISLTLSLSI